MSLHLERSAQAAYLTGKDEESAELWEQAYHGWVTGGDPPRAARCAFWLAYGLLTRGERTLGGGWLARAGRLLDESGYDNGNECGERGYLMLPVAMGHVERQDYARAGAVAAAAAELGRRFDDRDLMALGQHIVGRALIRQGRDAEGIALLDELILEIAADKISPVVVGMVYCAAIEGCQEVFDLQRAREWTAALTRWCAAQPDVVPYRGKCLVHRAEILQSHGSWPEAVSEVELVCHQNDGGARDPAAAAAWYRRAELHRLAGEFAQAEQAYRLAGRLGTHPQPGLALLRLAQGRVDVAASAIRRALAEAQGRADRCALLPAYVEIVLAAGDVPAARAAAGELAAHAAGLDAPHLLALAAHAEGSVLLAEADPRGALIALRQAWSRWHKLDIPYEEGRTRVLIAVACRALGDHDSAAMELDAAGWVFQQLGAATELDRAHALGRLAESAGRHPGADLLTSRELEVLRLVATGKTNRSIAVELFLSEKTVARHVSNIFAKVGVTTRAAATAYAYEHGLAG